MDGPFWLSKYALSGGLQKLGSGKAEVRNDGATWVAPSNRYGSFKLGYTIHDNEADAKKAAEAMRVKKIASLRKQIAKLEALRF